MVRCRVIRMILTYQVSYYRPSIRASVKKSKARLQKALADIPYSKQKN